MPQFLLQTQGNDIDQYLVRHLCSPGCHLTKPRLLFLLKESLFVVYIQAWIADPGDIREMSLEARMEFFVRSVLPQFDPLLKISNSVAPYGSLICSLKFAIVDSHYCFLWRVKLNLFISGLPCFPSPHWTASLISS